MKCNHCKGDFEPTKRQVKGLATGHYKYLFCSYQCLTRFHARKRYLDKKIIKYSSKNKSQITIWDVICGYCGTRRTVKYPFIRCPKCKNNYIFKDT